MSRLPSAIERARNLPPGAPLQHVLAYFQAKAMAAGHATFKTMACARCGASPRSYAARTGAMTCQRGHRTAPKAPAPRAGPPVKLENGVGTAAVRGVIDENAPLALIARLDAAKAADAKAVLLTVDSEGGNLEAAWICHDALKACGLPVAVYVPGRCASAATVLALAGTHIVLAPEASLMVHAAHGASQEKNRAETAALAALYLETTADSEDSILGYLGGGADVELSSTMALAHGWADAVGTEWHAKGVARGLARGLTPTIPRALALAARGQ